MVVPHACWTRCDVVDYRYLSIGSQVPVADSAVTLHSFNGYAGEAMAVGERTPLAVVNSPAAARMAVAEAVTNIASAPIEKLKDVRLSANWMAAAGEEGQDAALYAAVKSIGMDLCPALGIAIPVARTRSTNSK